MADDSMAQWWLDYGTKYPYAEGFQPKDAAERAALGALENLEDRRGIKQELREVDEDVRQEIVATLAGIIRAALSAPLTAEQDAKVAAMQECWDAIDRLYASTEPDDLRRKGLSMAASAISTLKRAALSQGEQA